MTGNFHDAVVTASAHHSVQGLLQIHHIGCGIVADSFFILDHDVDSTNQAHLIASLAQNHADDIGSGGLAIGTGNADHAQALAWIIIEIGSDYFHGCASILYHQQS